jgi:hypothetical protein
MNARLLLVLPLALSIACGEEEKTDDTQLDDTGSEDTGPVEDCQPVSFSDGDSGTYVVNSAGDDHVKHHFDMPENVHKLIVSGTWDSDWTMELDAGIGFCPHSGTTYAETYDTGGSLSLELTPDLVEAEAAVFEAGVQWFAHFGLNMPVGGPEDGATAQYTVSAEACTWV